MVYVYIVECRDGSLYTGWTTDINRRIEEHNQGKGAKYTKSRAPVKLRHFETYNTKPEAMKREWEIKQLTRSNKIKLITERNNGE